MQTCHHPSNTLPSAFHPCRTRRLPTGFTLIEVMVVLVILVLIAGLVAPRVMNQVDLANVRAAEVQVKNLRAGLQAFRLDVGRYPTTTEGLAALMSPPPEVADYWHGPYLDDELPSDPWRTPYRYESPVENLQGFVLYSLGADQAEGGEGDNADIGYVPEPGQSATS